MAPTRASDRPPDMALAYDFVDGVISCSILVLSIADRIPQYEPPIMLHCIPVAVAHRSGLLARIVPMTPPTRTPAAPDSVRYTVH
jgi:hypothetical protein